MTFKALSYVTAQAGLFFGLDSFCVPDSDFILEFFAHFPKDIDSYEYFNRNPMRNIHRLWFILETFG